MFTYFPKNPRLSAGLMLRIMGGGQIGQIERHFGGLRDTDPDEDTWLDAFVKLAEQQEVQAAEAEKKGYLRSASALYFRASLYCLTGERQYRVNDKKMEVYKAALASFEKARQYMDVPIERVEVSSPDGDLPGYLIPAEGSKPAPVVIFYNGFDSTKELLYGIIGHEFRRRGIACLVIDTPGTGEPLRLRNVPSRPDYEVPTKAIVDYLEARADVDKSRIGLLGISLGGYYAPRGAAFEPRIKACAAWGAIWDYGAVWRHRVEIAARNTSVPFWQLPWVMGKDTMEEALERVKAWKLEEALPHLRQPFLLVHGEKDAITAADAGKAYAAVGSVDKEMKIWTAEEGGAEHVAADDPDPTRQMIADWFLEKL